MRVIVNGETKELPPQLNLLGLADHFQLNLKQVAIERNSAIVPRSRFGETLLTDGDRIEIVQFIGGG